MAVEKMDGGSLSPKERLTEVLREECPEVFSEEKIDLERLKLSLGEEVSSERERYGLSWAGKADCFRHIQEPTTATLVPVREESLDFDDTENIFIEGDNLQVLKVLQKSYYGKIKMIYLDPPYNTGSDSFIYPDRFQETQAEYLQRIGDKDEEGNLTSDGFFQKNSKDGGHYHSNWLSMMYPRLFLARNLLREDGIIFISIDDNEVKALRMLMDEIYGEENFISQIVVQSNKRGQTYKQIAKTHEYLICYTKYTETELNELEKQESDLIYSDDLGDFNIRELRNRNPKFGRFNRPNLFFPIYVNPQMKDDNGFHLIALEKSKEFVIEVVPLNSEGKESCWRWSQKLISQKELTQLTSTPLIAKQKRDGGWNVYEKYRKTTVKAKTIWFETDVINEQGTIDLRELGMQGLFDHPKPVYLVEKALNIGSERDCIVLDFFAGACTTAQSVMSLNSKDGLNRKYMCVQLAEPCDKDSEAYKKGFKNIAEIGKERIRRASKMIADQHAGKLDFDGSQLDVGFKCFRLSESNFKIWRSDIDTAEDLEVQMGLFIDNVNENALQENILYELILKSGLDLNVSVEVKKAHGKRYFSLDGGRLIVCLEEKASQGLIDKIVGAKPEKVIFLDKAFGGNDQLKTNTALQMEAEKIDFKVI